MCLQWNHFNILHSWVVGFNLENSHPERLPLLSWQEALSASINFLLISLYFASFDAILVCVNVFMTETVLSNVLFSSSSSSYLSILSISHVNYLKEKIHCYMLKNCKSIPVLDAKE